MELLKKLNKNVLSYISTFLVLCVDLLSEHVILILNIDIKYYLACVFFINLVVSFKKHKEKMKNKENKQKNRGKKGVKKGG